MINGNKNLYEIEYKGNKILVIDFAKCNGKEEVFDLLETATDYMRSSEGNILSLIEIEGVNIDNKFMSRSNTLSKEVYQYKRKKGAILGVFGIKTILLKAYNLFSSDKLVPFSSKEDALEYLIK